MPSLRLKHRPTFIVKSGAALLLYVFCYLQLSAVAFGPPLILLQDIPPGVEVDLKKVGNFSYQIVNKSDKEGIYSLKAGKPHGKPGSWEYGFEAIPDDSWCTLHQNEITVAPNDTGHVSLTINIPDKPENYNRKFMVYVTLQPGRQGALGVGLGLAARLMIETTVKKGAEFTASKSIGISPGQINIDGKPGETFSHVVHIKNNLDYTILCNNTALSNFYPELKFARYQTNGFKLLTKDTWADSLNIAPFAPGEIKEITITGTIPKEAKMGEKIEEAFFIKATATENPKDVDQKAIDHQELITMNYLRIQYTIK